MGLPSACPTMMAGLLALRGGCGSHVALGHAVGNSHGVRACVHMVVSLIAAMVVMQWLDLRILGQW